MVMIAKQCGGHHQTYKGVLMTMQKDRRATAPPPTATLPVVKTRRKFSAVLGGMLPVLTFAAIVLIWDLSVRIFEIPKYLLPGPIEVFTRIFTSSETLWRNGIVTLQEIFLGFGLTVVTAIPLGLLVALSSVARRMVYPVLVFIQLVPKIAIAPLFIIWVGFGMESKVLLTVMMTFFPLLLASISGFQILDQRYLYLTRSMGATIWQTFRFLRFPSALPVIFSGLKTSATIAATAAIVAEFVGANRGLGYLLLQGTANLDITLVFAILLVLTVIGLALNYIVEFVEWIMTPWQRSRPLD
ncbi:ABC transporter permease [[Mycobacterium] appelbergii]|uniref:ABC transporter permease n=1 Tax=[Mycobacterium] appelbergii TaxID=2939269 RepID=UPI002938D1DE|nr:ABC transporter permease [Mycobacterium sp. 21AC1]